MNSVIIVSNQNSGHSVLCSVQICTSWYQIDAFFSGDATDNSNGQVRLIVTDEHRLYKLDMLMSCFTDSHQLAIWNAWTFYWLGYSSSDRSLDVQHMGIAFHGCKTNNVCHCDKQLNTAKIAVVGLLLWLYINYYYWNLSVTGCNYNKGIKLPVNVSHLFDVLYHLE